MLTAEALAALTGGDAVASATRAARERAEWCWAMLGDHAWNGADDANRRENAALRRRWAGDLTAAARDLADRAWNAAGFADRSDAVTLFNPTGQSRRDIVRFALPPGLPKREVRGPDGRALPSQHVLEGDGPVPLLRAARPRRLRDDDARAREGWSASPDGFGRDPREPRRSLLPAHR